MPEEPTSSAAESDARPGLHSSGVPTFESVREKIETRYETSIGAAELDAESPEGRGVEEQYAARQQRRGRAAGPDPRIDAHDGS